MFSSTPQTVRTPHLVGGPPTPRDIANLSSISGSAANPAQAEGLENAGRLVDHHLKEDASFVELSGQLRIATHGERAAYSGALIS